MFVVPLNSHTDICPQVMTSVGQEAECAPICVTEAHALMSLSLTDP